MFGDDPIFAEEARSIALEDEYRSLLIAEIRQRMLFRTVTVSTALIMLILMGVYAFSAFYHVSYVDARHALPWVGLRPATAVALVLAPIVSISTVTVMLLIGAFRRFKDDDAEIDLKSIMIEALRAGNSGPPA